MLSCFSTLIMFWANSTLVEHIIHSSTPPLPPNMFKPNLVLNFHHHTNNNENNSIHRRHRHQWFLAILYIIINYTTLQKKILPCPKVYFMIFQFIVHQKKSKIPIFRIKFAFVVVIIIINDDKDHFDLIFESH